jgi:RNA polymerase sigma-70 factor (sigma-E family)
VDDVTAPPTFEEYAALRMPALLRYAAVLTGDHQLAQDIVQEVLARAYAHWRRISRTDAPDRYVRRMVTNEFLSWRRRPASRALPIGEVADHRRPAWAAEPPDTAIMHAERGALLAEIARLPRRQQAVLVLRYYEGLSDNEIADVLGCRSGTVRGYAARALATLRVELDPAHARPEATALMGRDL